MLKPISKLLVLALIAMVGFSACSEDETNTIADELEDDTRFSTLKTLLDQTGLTARLEGAGTFTLFAPTNTALAGVDPAAFTNEELTEILAYHVLGSTVRAAGIPAGKTYLGTEALSAFDDNPLSVLINNSSGVRLNDVANVTETDIDAENGVIHVIDALIQPLDVVGHAQANDDFTSLVTTLAGTDSDGDGTAGELVGVLQGTGPFTVFAPINQAFSDISGTVAGLTDAQIGTVLTYHVASPANVLSSTLSDGQVVSTVAGQDFTIGIDAGNVTATDATGGVSNIIATDVQGTNGVIHVVDRVLLPTL